MTEHHRDPHVPPTPRADAGAQPAPTEPPTQPIDTRATPASLEPDQPTQVVPAPSWVTGPRSAESGTTATVETRALPAGELDGPPAPGAGVPVGLSDRPVPGDRTDTAAPAWPGSSSGQPPAGPGLGPLAGWEQQPQPSGTSTATRTRWAPVVGAAAAAAVLASLATAGLTGAFDPATSSTTAGSIATIGQSTTDTVPVAGSTADDPDWERVAASVAASVVAIEVSTAGGGGEGSGVVIDDSGHILTNNHVVEGAVNGTVQVTLNDGRLYEATVVGTDPSTDLAIIRIDDAPADLSPAALGDSDDVVVGAPVMAVGNPLGLANTVTTGIVSAVDRPVSAASSEATRASDVVVTNAIQIDAAINPGNSGGPLFDAEGRVVGITSSIATLSGSSAQSGSIGLGFAIPVNLAKGVAVQLIQDGTAEHAFLGVSLSDGTATADGVSRRGAVVEQVTEGSPAATAELRAGDVVVAIDGDAVGGAESLTAYVRERTAGDTVELTIVRDGQALDVTVTLATRETAVADVPQEESRGGLPDSGTDEGLLPGFPGDVDPFGDQG